MIPDFPEAKKKIIKSYNAFLRAEINERAPMASMLNKKTLLEGDKFGVLRADGTRSVNDLQAMQSEFSIANEDLPALRTEDVLEKVAGVAEDLAGQMERSIFHVIEQSTAESGNTISGNAGLNPETLLVGLEKIFINFKYDDRSKPVMPTLFGSPEGVKQLMEDADKRTPAEIEAFEKKQQIILDKKYDEYLADLASRRMVD